MSPRSLVRGKFSATVAMVALVAITAGCGARLSDDQREAALAAGQSATGGQSSARVPVGSTTTTAPGGGAAQPGGGDAGTTGGGGGTGGGGEGGGGGGGGAAACVAAPGSTDPGVSDTEIRLGNVSTITGPVPGFGESGRAGAKAYLEYVNSQGGVCGRQLVMVNGDDRLDPSANRSETEKLASQVFGFVGNTAVTDDGGASVIGGTNIPNCSLSVGDLAIQQPNYFSPNPLDPSGTTNGTVTIWQHFKATYGITKVGVVYAQNPSVTGRIKAFTNDIQAAGLAFKEYPVQVTETNYTGVATQMRNDGADSLIVVHEVNAIAKLAQAIKQVQWTPKVAYYGAQTYGMKFIELAGSAAEGALIAVTHDIVENQGNPVMQAMAEWYARTNPGESPDFFAILGWTAAELCVEAITAAGPAPTRDAVMTALQGINGWDGGGVLAPRDPAARRPPSGFAVITVEGGQWKRVYPESGFATS